MLSCGLTEEAWRDQLSSQKLIDFFYDEIFAIRLAILDYHSNIQSNFISMQTYQINSYPDFFHEKHAYIWQRKVVLEKIDAMYNMSNDFISYNDIRIFYTYLLAAITISRIHQFDHIDFLKSIYHLYKIYKESCHEIISCHEKVFSQLIQAKKDLINLLIVFSNNYNIEIWDKMLDEAKDWTALEKPSVVIMTSLEIKLPYQMHILIIDEPHCRLTEEQKKDLHEVHLQTWFKQLTPFQQQLVIYYRPFILLEECVLPSQLRSIIPLQKNAYTQSIWVKENNYWHQLNSYYHSGTTAYLYDKNEKISMLATQHNLLQQKMHCGTNASLMICLNSQIADKFVGMYAWWQGLCYKADDSNIIKLTHDAAIYLSDKHIYFSKICLNGFRKWEFQDYSGINNIIQIVKDNLFLLKDEVGDIIQKLENYLKIILKIQYEWKLIDTENRGLDIIYYLTQLAFLNNKLNCCYPDFSLQSIAICFGCASGENRTGIVYYNNICQSVIDYIEEKRSLTITEKQYLYNGIAASQHVHVMSGSQGSSLGTEGVRRQSASSLKSVYPKEMLLTQSADHKIIPLDHSLTTASNENKTGTSYGQYGLFFFNNQLSPNIWLNSFYRVCHQRKKNV